ncbi:MAG: FtsQ-type POTRA domain-containing protein [Verrucomicrobiaceae bacterium]|nr:FtsQ-type POTRA domain-containing protein [Verrucomicrobiaceae bacterium]
MTAPAVFLPFCPPAMPSAKKSTRSATNRSFRTRKGAAVPHIIDYEPESPIIRAQEAEAAKRRGFRNAVWLIVIIGAIALGKVVWEEAFEKNAQFLLRQLVVNTEGPLSVPRIVRATALTLDTNLLTLNIRDVRARLERLPQVKNVRIHRDYNGRLTLDVTQRIPVAWLECAKLKYYAARSGAGCLLDAEGVPMPCEVITKDFLSLPTIRFDGLSQAFYGSPIPNAQVHTALSLLKELNTRAETNDEAVKLIIVPNAWSMEAHFATAESKVITFGADDLEQQLERYERVLHSTRTRQWKLATLNLIPAGNTPVTFHGTPDLAGITLTEHTVTPSK